MSGRHVLCVSVEMANPHEPLESILMLSAYIGRVDDMSMVSRFDAYVKHHNGPLVDERYMAEYWNIDANREFKDSVWKGVEDGGIGVIAVMKKFKSWLHSHDKSILDKTTIISNSVGSCVSAIDACLVYAGLERLSTLMTGNHTDIIDTNSYYSGLCRYEEERARHTRNGLVDCNEKRALQHLELCETHDKNPYPSYRDPGRIAWTYMLISKS